MKIVSPARTLSSRRPRSAVSPATPAAAATAQSTAGGLAAQESSTLRRSTPCWTPGRPSRPGVQHGVLRLSVLDSWAAKPPAVDWAVAAAAGVAGETAERGLRLLNVRAGDTIFIDGGAGGVGAVAVQMAVACGARVIASASEANQDYLRELGATAVRYGEGMIARVRDAAGGPVNAVFDVAGKTPIEDLVSLAPEPSQVLTIANFAAAQAGARVTGGGADSRPMEALAQVAELLAQNKLVIKVQTFPFDRAADAYRISQAGHVRGKLVLVP